MIEDINHYLDIIATAAASGELGGAVGAAVRSVFVDMIMSTRKNLQENPNATKEELLRAFVEQIDEQEQIIENVNAVINYDDPRRTKREEIH